METNYTGYAVFLAALNMWHPCDRSYSKGSAGAEFENGKCVHLLWSKCDKEDEALLLASII
jgi:hypothetical protein